VNFVVDLLWKAKNLEAEKKSNNKMNLSGIDM
jgi:hypothetical protein